VGGDEVLVVHEALTPDCTPEPAAGFKAVNLSSGPRYWKPGVVIMYEMPPLAVLPDAWPALLLPFDALGVAAVVGVLALVVAVIVARTKVRRATVVRRRLAGTRAA
jgi:hypothetical protein